MDEQRQSNVSKLYHKALLTSSRRRRRRQCLCGGVGAAVSCLSMAPRQCLPLAALCLVCCLVLFVHIHNYQLRRFAKHNNNRQHQQQGHIRCGYWLHSSAVMPFLAIVLRPFSFFGLFDNVYRCKFQSELLFYRSEKCCNTQA